MSIGIIFPGQGSQSVGMLAGLAGEFPEVCDSFAEASAELGYDLWQLVCDGPADRLNSTDVTQPAMLAAGVATWRIWQAQGGPMPTAMAGHSLGEYTALVCAGALAFSDAVRLVAERGRLMQAAVPAGEGAMAAILGLDDDTVRQVCEQAAQGQVVAAVNFNSPGQVVVAGHTQAVERAVAQAKQAGAKRAVVLPVSVPSHCALMQGAAEQLAQRLEGISIQTPQVPVINNVDVASPDAPAAIRDALARQLHQPVRWVEVIRAMAARGVERIVECGPGKVLVGLNKRIDKSLRAQAVVDPASLAEALAEATATA